LGVGGGLWLGGGGVDSGDCRMEWSWVILPPYLNISKINFVGSFI